ncbi:putative odorant-binding protein A10 [Scaptodrosophila lebanonensis]|uniref:Odorant-binding protein A10 n=1 Tax=Drosophila lebanonensis TaxID=7225 RepID=A0A6J2UDV4_DROLE|nr:putative odorant-binding protein A10 [Scaptodrosophila lebanonensis]
MKTILKLSAIMSGLAIALLMLCTICQGLPHPPPTPAGAYDNKFDNVDLDEILAQERLLNNYIKCLEGNGPCTPDAKMLKDILPDAIQTDCVKCTEKQKYGAEKVTRHLIDHRPADWERLEKIYDPQGTYRIKYENSKSSSNGKDEQKVEFEAAEAQGDS